MQLFIVTTGEAFGGNFMTLIVFMPQTRVMLKLPGEKSTS